MKQLFAKAFELKLAENLDLQSVEDIHGFLEPAIAHLRDGGIVEVVRNGGTLGIAVNETELQQIVLS